MEQKQLLRQLWDIEASRTTNGNACRLQLQTESGPTEFLVCSKAVLMDYAPSKTLEAGKLYTVNKLPLKKLEDISRVYPENMLCEESLNITKDAYIDACFMPLNNWHEIGMGVFSKDDEKVVLESVLPYLKSGSFQFAGLALHYIPDEVRWEINKNSSLAALNARIGKMRTGPVLVLLLSCDTALLVVTLSKIPQNKPQNNNIFMSRDLSDHYRLDGLREDGVFYTRLVKGRNNLKGLANPVKRKEAQPAESVHVPEENPPIQDAPAAEAEPQVEDIQPEQADEIAEQAPEATSVEQPKEAAPAEEPKKRTRMKRVAVAPSANASKLIDDLITYLGSPVADSMTSDQMQEEVRKLRDLGVVLARRQSNLFTAATASEKKLRDVLRGVLG
jgi:hypothetical protein